MFTISVLEMHPTRPLVSAKVNALRARASKGFGPPPPPPKASKPKQQHANTPAELRSVAAGEAPDPSKKSLHDKLGAVSVVFLGDNGGKIVHLTDSVQQAHIKS